MLLVDDHDADIGERREDREPRPDDDVHVAAADAPPLVGPLAVAEARMDDADPGVEVRPEPVDRGSASAISGTRTSARRPAASVSAIASA